MSNIIQDLILNTIDPGIRGSVSTIPAGHLLEDKSILLASKREVKISNLVKNGPLLLTFIRGTWCPFCRIHLQKLRDWVNKLKSKNSTIIVVSSEYPEAINTWLESNPVPYIFASDAEYALADYFGVRIKQRGYFQAATFVIGSDLSVTLAYSGKRTKKLYNHVEKALNN